MPLFVADEAGRPWLVIGTPGGFDQSRADDDAIGDLPDGGGLVGGGDAETDGEGIYSAERLQQGGFNSGSVLQRALSSLMEKEIISKNGIYQFQDAMLKKWIQRLS